MSTPLRRRVLAVLVCLATVFVGAAVTQPAGAATTGTVTFSKAKLSPSTDLANIARGQYRWLGGAPSPSTWPARDIYYRDQVYWGRLEPTRGAYDFTWIEDGLRRAGETKGKFGFRVMAYCPGCWMNSRAGFPAVTPSYLPLQSGTAVPDWNSETFLSSWEKLMAALGARYANDKRLGSIDVGGYGKYGEWWVDVGTQKITDANALRMVAAVNRAFPAKTVLFNTMTSVDLTLKALATNPRMGLRTDSLGARNMNSMIAVDTRLQSVWKTRPIHTEWASNGEPVLGRDQVKAFHLSTLSSGNLRLSYDAMTSTQKSAYLDGIRSSGYRYYVSKVTIGSIVRGKTVPVTVTMSNLGVAPTYDGWSVQLWLMDSAGKKVWAKALAIDPRKVLPGTKTATTYLAVPTTLPRGTYTATLAVVDKLGYSAPMYLSNYTRRANGSYTLGAVVAQ